MGKGSRGKAQVVIWETSRLRSSGEVEVLTKAHTEVSIEKMRVAAFDNSRCVHVCMCRCVYACMCRCVHACMCACVGVCMCEY